MHLDLRRRELPGAVGALQLVTRKLAYLPTGQCLHKSGRAEPANRDSATWPNQTWRLWSPLLGKGSVGDAVGVWSGRRLKSLPKPASPPSPRNALCLCSPLFLGWFRQSRLGFFSLLRPPSFATPVGMRVVAGNFSPSQSDDGVRP